MRSGSRNFCKYEEGKEMKERMDWELKKIGARSVQGAVIGVFLVYTMGMVMGGLQGQGDVSYAFLLRQYVAGFIIGGVFNVMNLLFEKGTMGLTQTTFLHFMVTFLAFIPMGFYAGWLAPENVLMALIIFILLYAGIWFGSYLMWKNDVDRINSHLKNR
jgi:hypothetical protein